LAQYIPLTLESLSEIDGGTIGVLFKRAAEQIARDLLNRPTDTTERQITAHFEALRSSMGSTSFSGLGSSETDFVRCPSLGVHHDQVNRIKAEGPQTAGTRSRRLER